MQCTPCFWQCVWQAVELFGEKSGQVYFRNILVRNFICIGFLAGCTTSETFLTHVCTCFCCRETCTVHPRPQIWNMWTDVKIMIVMLFSAEFSTEMLEIHLWKKASGSVEASWWEDTASSCIHTHTRAHSLFLTVSGGVYRLLSVMTVEKV